jgi:hypothetical protein
MQLAETSDGLKPAEDLLHPFADSQADAVSLVAGSSTIYTRTLLLLCLMNGGNPPAALF